MFRFRKLLSLVLSASLLSHPTLANTEFSLPEIGDPSGALMTPAEEKRLGDAFMRQVRAQQNVVDDPALTAYIQSVGKELVANTDGETSNFTFFLVDSPAINAFAGPGGYIGVNTGLILASRSESELAGVLAHEIAHVTQRHLFRRFYASKSMETPLLAAMIVGLLIGAGTGNSDAGMAAVAGLQAGAAQRNINYTRAHEQEADRIGVVTLARSGFDPMGMPSFFERLNHSIRYYDSRKMPEFLRTHPVTLARIADTRSRAESLPKPKVARDELSYDLAKATLLARSQAPRNVLNTFETLLKSGQHNSLPATRYGHALALLENGRYQDALNVINDLLAQDADHPIYRFQKAELLLKIDRFDQALAEYADTLEFFPNNHQGLLGYSAALIEYDDPAKARNLLLPLARADNANPAYFKLLAQAYGYMAEKGERHAWMAEYYYANGMVEKAVRQLELALNDPLLNDYRGQELGARLTQFEDEAKLIKERKKEGRI